jgi:hypothetical protein
VINVQYILDYGKDSKKKRPRFLGKRDHARREALRNRRLRGHGLPWLTVQSTIWRVNNPNRIAWNCANKALGRNVVSQTHLR